MMVERHARNPSTETFTVDREDTRFEIDVHLMNERTVCIFWFTSRRYRTERNGRKHQQSYNQEAPHRPSHWRDDCGLGCYSRANRFLPCLSTICTNSAAAKTLQISSGDLKMVKYADSAHRAVFERTMNCETQRG